MTTSGKKPTVKKEFVMDRGGKVAVLYRGLLDLAHEMGLRSIQTELIQIPTEANGNVAIMKARVTMFEALAPAAIKDEMEGGAIDAVFEGYGDASPENVTGPAMRNALIRFAETRAKARALRDAVNIGDVAVEELDDEPEGARVDVRRQPVGVTTARREKAEAERAPALPAGLQKYIAKHGEGARGALILGHGELLDKATVLTLPVVEAGFTPSTAGITPTDREIGNYQIGVIWDRVQALGKAIKAKDKVTANGAKDADDDEPPF